jgi:uncharacterized protein YndB with AHSA1/START domain
VESVDRTRTPDALVLDPKGVTIAKADLDLRPGGVFHYCMETPDGHEMWGKWTFLEITPPDRLIVIVSFSDANQGITRHPMSATWPLETLSKTTFTDTTAGRRSKSAGRFTMEPLRSRRRLTVHTTG